MIRLFRRNKFKNKHRENHLKKEVLKFFNREVNVKEFGFVNYFHSSTEKSSLPVFETEEKILVNLLKVRWSGIDTNEKFRIHQYESLACYIANRLEKEKLEVIILEEEDKYIRTRIYNFKSKGSRGEMVQEIYKELQREPLIKHMVLKEDLI